MFPEQSRETDPDFLRGWGCKQVKDVPRELLQNSVQAGGLFTQGWPETDRVFSFNSWIIGQNWEAEPCEEYSAGVRGRIQIRLAWTICKCSKNRHLKGAVERMEPNSSQGCIMRFNREWA